MVVMPNTTPDLELLLELFVHPLEPLDYMVIRWTPNSKSSLLVSSSSKYRTCSSITKRYRTDLVEFLNLKRVREWEREREREIINSLWNFGEKKETEDRGEKDWSFSKKLRSFQDSLRVLGCRLHKIDMDSLSDSWKFQFE